STARDSHGLGKLQPLFQEASQMRNRFFLGKDCLTHDGISTSSGNVSWLACFVALLLFFATGSAIAQLSGKGAITGTVTDKTGAVIPNAMVTATNTSTKISAETKTTGS